LIPPGTGTALNCITILVGGGVGTIAGERIPQRLRHNLLAVLGLFTLVYGVRTALLTSVGGARIDLADVLVALIIGTALGTLLRLDLGIAAFGRLVERRLGRRRGSIGLGSERSLATAFVTTSLLFCIGPLTVLGSFQDGGQGDILLLGIKSGLDGVAALAFAVSLGPGVLLSAVTVLLVQGTLTAAAAATRGNLDGLLVTQSLAAGGFLLTGIGLGLLEIRRVAVADMLPALAIAPLVAWVARALNVPI